MACMHTVNQGLHEICQMMSIHWHLLYTCSVLTQYILEQTFDLRSCKVHTVLFLTIKVFSNCFGLNKIMQKYNTTDPP
jgi:hypothetical protein